jgi:hypothetical protein
LFLATFITGFAEPHINPGDAGHHTLIAILFMIFVFIHFALNLKAFTRYLGGPSKKTLRQ